ncbi:flagellar basal body protein [Ramlibacter sp. WS9]|uniref:flagellar basal body protein n=1 Tax=Ramlibacter sp. WS9 TaxID=1882741 RepID=UPI0011449260|nr:flagellar basal body protein [Ramlibacter sp. WS9]ROZ63187.1 flagellar basal body protein [Ramlibacter sp. WS9]
MTEGLEAITTAALGLALDAASLRHQAIAANIANHATVGYVPQKLDFESQMREAQRVLQSKGSIDAFALSGVRLQLEPVLDAQGQPAKVQLDEQVADMAQNSVHYQLLARGLSRHLSILSTAASDGKR